MTKQTSIFAFSTSNYDQMTRFLVALGFQVVEGHDQLLPLFGGLRAARVTRGDLDFNLEESTVLGQKASFNLFLTDYSDEEIAAAKAGGYKYENSASLYGEFHTFHSPDGGIFVI
jgi:hypothetical protein